MKVIQLLKLPIDCNVGRGDGSRKSHLKLCYQILHEIRVPWLLAYSTAINVLCDTYMAFLGYFWFWMGNIGVARWNGFNFLIPKHLRKSKIGLLEQIWAKNPYVTFFLGHPVYFKALCSDIEILKLCASLVGFCTLAGDCDDAGGGFWLHWIGSKDWKGGFPRGLLGRCWCPFHRKSFALLLSPYLALSAISHFRNSFINY